jgi:hypothetical protein
VRARALRRRYAQARQVKVTLPDGTVVSRTIPRSRGTRGARYYEGRQLLLSGRFTGLDAKADAAKEAARFRERGYFARVVKYGTYDYAVFTLLNEDTTPSTFRRNEGL